MNKKTDIESSQNIISTGEHAKRVEVLYKMGHIERDLSLPFETYFLLHAFRYLTMTNSGKGGLLLLSTESDSGVKDFLKGKEFIHKNFVVERKKRKHLLRISIQKNGIFKALHDIDFINTFVWGLDPAQNYIEGICYNLEIESLHYIYTGDQINKCDEIVVLSVQTILAED